MNKLYTQLFEKCRSKYESTASSSAHKKDFNKTINFLQIKPTVTSKPPLKKINTEKKIIKQTITHTNINNASSQAISKHYQTSVPITSTNRESSNYNSLKNRTIRSKISKHSLEFNVSMKEKLNQSKEVCIDNKRKAQIKLCNSNNSSFDNSFNKTLKEFHTTLNPSHNYKYLKKSSIVHNPITNSDKKLSKKISSRFMDSSSNLTLTVSYIKDDIKHRNSEATKLKKEPLTAFKALAQHINVLTNFEKKEIITYKDIYYVGADAKKVEGCFALFKCNFGFDDSDSDYVIQLHDHIAYRYEIMSILGKGSFGQVIKCFDHKCSELVAIKIIKNQERLQYQATVELKLLKYIASKGCNENYAIKLKNSFVFRKHLCYVFELLGPNLYEMLRLNLFKGIETSTIKKIAFQLLNCLKFLKQHDIIHCDLKPENILVKENSKYDIKVIDFGSGCFSKEQLYTYIQSRFYRAPEIILGIKYSTAIDMWSFGLILGELCKGYPILPGQSEKEQIELTIELRGMPPISLLKRGKRTQLFFDDEYKPLNGYMPASDEEKHGIYSLSHMLCCRDANFLDLIDVIA